jgi:hypothetical protein
MYEVCIEPMDGTEESIVHEDLTAAMEHAWSLRGTEGVRNVEVVIMRTGAVVSFEPPNHSSDPLLHIRPDGSITSCE